MLSFIAFWSKKSCDPKNVNVATGSLIHIFSLTCSKEKKFLLGIYHFNHQEGNITGIRFDTFKIYIISHANTFEIKLESGIFLHNNLQSENSKLISWNNKKKYN